MVYLVPFSILIVLVGLCKPVPVGWLLPVLKISPDSRRLCGLRIIGWLDDWLDNWLLISLGSNIVGEIVSSHWSLAYELILEGARVHELRLDGIL